MSTVIIDPASRDYFTLDGMRSPGYANISSGGEAAEKIEDQQQPLTRGSNTVVRGTMNAVTTYEIYMWTDAQLQAWNTWEAMFLAGRQTTPPRVYALVDLRYSWVSKVIFEKMAPEKREKPGGPWTRSLTVHQWVKVKKYGGPVVPGAIDGLLKAAEAEKAALKAQVAALSKQVAAIPAGKP
jgi:hypothetical protein